MARNRKAAVSTSPRAPALEWIVAGLGLVCVATALVVILAQVITGAGRPPELSAVVGERRGTPNGWVVEVQVRNDGDETAAGVQVRGDAGGQTAEAELDYVPAHGQARASLRFKTEPGPDLTVGVAGWREP